MFKKILTLLIAISLIACGAGGQSSGNNNNIQPDNNKINLQAVLDNAINSSDAKSGHLTGIPLTFQCNAFNKNQPSTLSVGKINNQPNAATLPEDAIFEVASISKSFLAIVAIQLESEQCPNGKKCFGDNGLDSTVGEVLGYDVYPKWNNIRLRQLLNMTSGIIDRNDTEINQMWSNNPYHYFSTNEMLQLIANYDLKFTSGTNWAYSNTNYILMSEIITKVTGISTKNQVINRIIKPLNLTHTYYIENLPKNEISEQQKSLFMSGYFYSDFSPQSQYVYFGVDTTQFSLSFANGSGSMLSSTADINTYIRELFAPNSKLLNTNQFKELTTFVAMQDEGKYKAGDYINDDINKNVPLGYGLGIGAMYIEMADGKHAIVYNHSGELQGFKTQWGYVKDKNASFVVAINSTHPDASHVLNKLVNTSVEKIFTDCLIQ